MKLVRVVRNKHVKASQWGKDRKGAVESCSHHRYTWLLSELIRGFWFGNLNHHHLLLLLFLYGSELNFLSRTFSWRNGAHVNNCPHSRWRQAADFNPDRSVTFTGCSSHALTFRHGIAAPGPDFTSTPRPSSRATNSRTPPFTPHLL